MTMEQKLIILAPAKINLYLDVTGKRPDGYHNIESVMQSVSLFDRITVTKKTPQSGNPITVTTNSFPLSLLGEKNLAAKAARRFFEINGIDTYAVEIHIEKKIPSEAGLGGGSSDAAATLIALDRLYETNLSTEALCKTGASLGADIPFCILGGTAKCEGIGDLLTPLPSLPPCHILIAKKGGGKMGTAEAYRLIDSLPANEKGDFSAFLRAAEERDLSAMGKLLYNKFECITPEETGSLFLIEALQKTNALGVRMSGSGAAVFALYHTREDAETAADTLPADTEIHICTPFAKEHIL